MITVRVPARIDFAGGWSDVPDFAGEEGGAVLNAAIDLYTEGRACWTESGLDLSLHLAVSPDSHLGTSSSTNLAWVELIAGLTRRTLSDVERAEQAARIERAMGEKGGKQDQYAAALGGINLLRFGGADEPAEVTPIILPEPANAELAECCLLCHAGSSPDSGDLHAQVWRRFADGDVRVRQCLRAIRDSVEPARSALEKGDWAALAAEMTRNRELARALGGGAVTERMDALFQAGERAGALGAKGCGAGGGGYVLFLCEQDARSRVEQALTELGAPVRRFGFAPRRGVDG
jgi:D-glycero-alpha-D-manno-heptose-7-phosphate kinase